MILIIIILFILVLIILCKKNMKETYGNYGYNKWQWQLYNMNWNKPWKNKEVAYNNPYPQDIPVPSANDSNFPQYILEIVKEKYIKRILNMMLAKDFSDKKYNLRYVDITSDELYGINKDTWYNRLDEFNIYNAKNYENNQMKFPAPKSCIPDVNKIIKYFISTFNRLFSRVCHEKFIRDYFGYSPFTLYKFKIHHIKQARLGKDQGCIVNYGIILVIIRDESYVGITIYLEANHIKNKIYFTYFDIIGYYETDQLFLPAGYQQPFQQGYFKFDPYNFYELNPLYRNRRGEINYYNVDEQLIKRRQYHLDNTLKQQYTCFNAEPEYYNPLTPTGVETTAQPILKYTYNKYNCESKYDQYGRRKPRGLWDRPCLADYECPFYEKNKNYPNRFGKCNKLYGFCELPQGMKNLGYHYWYPYKGPIAKGDKDNPICNPPKGRPKPLCYNCLSANKSGVWKPMTNLDTCCDDQWDRRKYPHLNGPDYAFNGDINSRLRYQK